MVLVEKIKKQFNISKSRVQVCNRRNWQSWGHKIQVNFYVRKKVIVIKISNRECTSWVTTLPTRTRSWDIRRTGGGELCFFASVGISPFEVGEMTGLWIRGPPQFSISLTPCPFFLDWNLKSISLGFGEEQSFWQVRTISGGLDSLLTDGLSSLRSEDLSVFSKHTRASELLSHLDFSHFADILHVTFSLCWSLGNKSYWWLSVSPGVPLFPVWSGSTNVSGFVNVDELVLSRLQFFNSINFNYKYENEFNSRGNYYIIFLLRSTIDWYITVFMELNCLNDLHKFMEFIQMKKMSSRPVWTSYYYNLFFWKIARKYV